MHTYPIPVVREGVELEMPRRLSVTIVSLTLHISLVCGLHRSIDFTADCREDAELSRGIDVTSYNHCRLLCFFSNPLRPLLQFGIIEYQTNKQTISGV